MQTLKEERRNKIKFKSLAITEAIDTVKTAGGTFNGTGTTGNSGSITKKSGSVVNCLKISKKYVTVQDSAAIHV